MKEILFIQTQKYPDVVGGAEIFDYYLINELNNNYNISYIAHSPWPRPRLKCYTILKIKPYAIFSSIQIFFKIFSQRKNIQLIHFRYSRSKWFNYWPYIVAKFLFGIPYIITIHGGGLTPWKFKQFYNFLFSHALNIVGVSNKICKEYEKRSKREIHFIPPIIPFQKANIPIEIIREELGLLSQLKIFLIVGSLKSIKNPLTVLKAIKLLGGEYLKEKQVKFLFLGDGHLMADMKNFSYKNNLNEYVRLEGNVTREKVKNYYTVADHYIISSDFEGTPISMLEAMFNALPIIASDVQGINCIIKNMENGLLYEVKNHRELSFKIKFMIDQQAASKKMAQNAELFFLQNFDFSKVINAYSKFIKEA